jgi:hypothetical protein
MQTKTAFISLKNQKQAENYRATLKQDPWNIYIFGSIVEQYVEMFVAF